MPKITIFDQDFIKNLQDSDFFVLQEEEKRDGGMIKGLRIAAQGLGKRIILVERDT